MMDCFSRKKIFKVSLRVRGRMGLIEAAPFERSPRVPLTGMSGDFRNRANMKGPRRVPGLETTECEGHKREDIFHRGV